MAAGRRTATERRVSAASASRVSLYNVADMCHDVDEHSTIRTLLPYARGDKLMKAAATARANLVETTSFSSVRTSEGCFYL